VGATILGAFFGRKIASAGSVGRATTAMRGMGRAARERQDIGRAIENVDDLRRDLAAMEAELQQELEKIQQDADPSRLQLEEVPVRPRKSDITVGRVALVWTPRRISPEGIAEPAY